MNPANPASCRSPVLTVHVMMASDDPPRFAPLYGNHPSAAKRSRPGSRAARQDGNSGVQLAEEWGTIRAAVRQAFGSWAQMPAGARDVYVRHAFRQMIAGEQWDARQLRARVRELIPEEDPALIAATLTDMCGDGGEFILTGEMNVRAGPQLHSISEDLIGLVKRPQALSPRQR